MSAQIREKAANSLVDFCVLTTISKEVGKERPLMEVSEGPMRNLLKFFDRLSIARWAPVPLRLIVGYGFIEHGFAKLSRGPDAFAALLHVIGVPLPHLMAWLTIFTEVFGGLAVLLGAFVPLVSLPMAAVLLVAILTVHLPYGFSSIKLVAVTANGARFGPVGYETNLLYLACLTALVLGGPGPLAIDAHIKRRTSRRGSRLQNAQSGNEFESKLR